MSRDLAGPQPHARFYFHLDFKGHLLRDREGEVLASPHAAQARGFAIARALLDLRGRSALDPDGCVLQVADEHSRTLCTIALSGKAPARMGEAPARAVPKPSAVRKRARRRAARKPAVHALRAG